ncbi:MAG: DUF4395 domain-containing protein [Limnobacter sp.]|nr:DUF4395 domain-containing protein [Limnobacter sp.]
MLRFDVPPVYSNVARADAFVTFVLSVAALAFGLPWLFVILAAAGFVRGFFGHSHCPVHRLHRALLEARGWAGKKENAGPKMFAAKLLFVASAASVVLWLLGSPMWQVPAAVLAVFSFAEWAFSFCAACWAYTLWYRLRSQ